MCLSRAGSGDTGTIKMWNGGKRPTHSPHLHSMLSSPFTLQLKHGILGASSASRAFSRHPLKASQRSPQRVIGAFGSVWLLSLSPARLLAPCRQAASVLPAMSSAPSPAAARQEAPNKQLWENW